MEENIVTMGSNNATEETKKLSYEELEQVAKELHNQCRMLGKRLQKAEEFIFSINKMDYLFKVVENHKVFDEGFVLKCAEDIKETLTKEDSPKENA